MNKKIRSFINKEKSDIYATIGYMVLTLIMTYPVIFKITDYILGGGDAWWYIWDIWLFKKSLLDIHILPTFTDYIFYPSGISMSTSDITPYNGIVSIPLQIFFGEIVTYNLLNLSTFALSGYGMYLLVKYLTNNKYASFIAGIIFAFNPQRMGFLEGFLSLISTQWIPFFILYLFKMTKEKKINHTILASIFFVLATYSSWYYMVYIIIFTVIYILWLYVADPKYLLDRTIVRNFLLFTIIAFLLILPFLYSIAVSIFNGSMNSGYYSADLLGFFIPQYFSTFFGKYFTEINANIIGNPAGSTIYVGYTIIFLIVYAIYRCHDSIKFWIISSLLFLFLSMGPYLYINGVDTKIPLPFFFMNYMPFSKFLGILHRLPFFGVMLMLSLSIMSGFALKDIFIRYNSKRNILFSLIIFLIMVEYAAIPYPMSSTKIPEFYYQLKDDLGDYAILEVPVGDTHETFEYYQSYQYYQTIHEKKIVGGYISRVPLDMDDFIDSTPVIRELRNPALKNFMIKQNTSDIGSSVLNFYNIRYIILHEKYMNKDQLDFANNLLLNISTEKRVYKEDQMTVYKIEKTNPGPFVLLKNTYGVDTWQNGVNVSWMKSNATIINYSPDIKESNISLSAVSFYKPRLLQVFLNDKPILQQIIDTNFDKLELTIRLKDGENSIRFYSQGGCQMPADIPELKNDDARCLNIALANISFT